MSFIHPRLVRSSPSRQISSATTLRKYERLNKPGKQIMLSAKRQNHFHDDSSCFFRAEVAEREGMLRTKAMREKEEQREKRKYRYSLIRVRFPDGIVLQVSYDIEPTSQKALLTIYASFFPSRERFLSMIVTARSTTSWQSPSRPRFLLSSTRPPPASSSPITIPCWLI